MRPNLTGNGSQIARRQLAPYEQKYNTSYLAGLPHDDLIGRLKLLPRDSIVILLTVFADGTGRTFIPTEMAREVASASSAPVFSPYESHLGRGVVGGHTDSFDSIGNEVGDLALANSRRRNAFDIAAAPNRQQCRQGGLARAQALEHQREPGAAGR